MRGRKSQLAKRRERREGTATVELAVCLPLLVLLVFGSIQACDMIYLRHSLTTAAYEGSLEVSRPDATTAAVEGRIQQVLELRGVADARIELRPARVEVSESSVGDPLTIVVTVPVERNLMLSGFFLPPTETAVEMHCTR